MSNSVAHSSLRGVDMRGPSCDRVSREQRAKSSDLQGALPGIANAWRRSHQTYRTHAQQRIAFNVRIEVGLLIAGTPTMRDALYRIVAVTAFDSEIRQVALNAIVTLIDRWIALDNEAATT